MRHTNQRRVRDLNHPIFVAAIESMILRIGLLPGGSWGTTVGALVARDTAADVAGNRTIVDADSAGRWQVPCVRVPPDKFDELGLNDERDDVPGSATVKGGQTNSGERNSNFARPRDLLNLARRSHQQ